MTMIERRTAWLLVLLGSVSFVAAGQSVSWTQESVPVSPSARYGPAMCYDPTRRVTFLFGGYMNNVGAGDTWAWNGAKWTLLPVDGPSGRSSSMAFDRVRGEMVLFGGDDGVSSVLNDTWTWDGHEWTLQVPVNRPPRLRYYSIAYDEVRHEIVLFGGQGAGLSTSGQTWIWDGTNWQNRISPGPAGRRSAGMAFDASRGIMVLYGGYDDANNLVYADVWEWDGSTWSSRPSSGPGVRCGPMMTYDAARRVVVMHGGQPNPQIGTSTANDTWEWDGTSWTLRSTGGPGGRFSSGFTYDENRAVTVLFGGANGQQALADTWEYCGVGVIVPPQPAFPCPRGAASFTVVAGGAGPIGFSWRFNGVAIDPIGNPSAHTNVLSLDDIHPSQEGIYDCEVSNACGSTISPAADLRYCAADVNCDDLVDLVDFFQFLNDFDQSQPGADVNADESIDLADFFDFLGGFDRGC